MAGKACTKACKKRDIARSVHFTGIRGIDARNHAQEGGFARPVSPDDADDFTLIDFDVHVLESGEFTVVLFDEIQHNGERVSLLWEMKANVIQLNGRLRHRYFTAPRSYLENTMVPMR